jgi:hypothetical protein
MCAVPWESVSPTCGRPIGSRVPPGDAAGRSPNVQIAEQRRAIDPLAADRDRKVWRVHDPIPNDPFPMRETLEDDLASGERSGDGGTDVHIAVVEVFQPRRWLRDPQHAADVGRRAVCHRGK